MSLFLHVIEPTFLAEVCSGLGYILLDWCLFLSSISIVFRKSFACYLSMIMESYSERSALPKPLASISYDKSQRILSFSLNCYIYKIKKLVARHSMSLYGRDTRRSNHIPAPFEIIHRLHKKDSKAKSCRNLKIEIGGYTAPRNFKWPASPAT